MGPCSADPLAHRQLRATWWHVTPEAIQLASSLRHEGEVVLWFGPDPWEQMSLIEILAGAPAETISLVTLDHAVGNLTPAALRLPFERRRDAAGLVPLAAGLWRDFCDDDARALSRWVEALATDLRLPHLPLALARILEDRRAGRTERQVRTLVAEGVTEVPALMLRLQTMEHPRHGVWYGDVIVRRLAERIARER